MFNQICNIILSPPKFKYSLYDLGSSITKYGKRTDFIVYNKKKYKMNCSYYQPFQIQHQKSCIIYLHSMNGSRLENHILKLGISLCSFDFSGCGNSQGNKISFGANQKYQVQIVINQLKSKFNCYKFVLWGRSMGAVSAIKYTQMIYQKYQNKEKDQIIGLILDSSFKNLSKLLIQIGSNRTDIPKFLVKEENGQFNIDQLDLIYEDGNQKQSPIQKIKGNNLAALFLVSKQDKTVPYQNSVDMYNYYNSNKKQMKFFKGLHNESRNLDYINQVINFINKLFEFQKQRYFNPIKSLKSFKLQSQFQILNQHNKNILSLSRSSNETKKQKSTLFNTFHQNRLSKNNLYKKLQQKQQQNNNSYLNGLYEFQNSQAMCVCSVFNTNSSLNLKQNKQNLIKDIELSKKSENNKMPSKKIHYSRRNIFQQNYDPSQNIFSSNKLNWNKSFNIDVKITNGNPNENSYNTKQYRKEKKMLIFLQYIHRQKNR